MSTISWGKIIEKEKYNNNSRLKLNKWIKIRSTILLKNYDLCKFWKIKKTTKALPLQAFGWHTSAGSTIVRATTLYT